MQPKIEIVAAEQFKPFFSDIADIQGEINRQIQNLQETPIIQHDNFPELTYIYKKERPGTLSEEAAKVKSGQRKLILTALDFIADFITPNIKYILYVGSAPGYSIKVILDYFPQITILSVDPRPLGFKSKHLGTRLFHWQKYFSCELYDEMREQFADLKNNFDTLFLSDIRDVRGTPTSGNDITCTEEYIMQDMIMQAEWILYIKPVASVVKFRLPYIEGIKGMRGKNVKFTYFDGQIRVQPYIGQHSTETRLIITDITKWRVYDAAKYERQMYFLNTVCRRKIGDRYMHAELFGVNPNNCNVVDVNINLDELSKLSNHELFYNLDTIIEIKILQKIEKITNLSLAELMGVVSKTVQLGPRNF